MGVVSGHSRWLDLSADSLISRMGKNTRSVSLPERHGGVTDKLREVRTVLKVNDNRRTAEKENEVEEQFGRGSLSFRVDQMTLTPRKEIMERQKKLADCNMDREIDCFYNMINQLTEIWQDEEMKDILGRMSTVTLGLRHNIASLAHSSASLGSLRQECCYSNTMTGVGQYVELLKEKTLKLHEKVLDTKKILIDNKIDVERHYTECKERLILYTRELMSFFWFIFSSVRKESFDCSGQISL